MSAPSTLVGLRSAEPALASTASACPSIAAGGQLKLTWGGGMAPIRKRRIAAVTPSARPSTVSTHSRSSSADDAENATPAAVALQQAAASKESKVARERRLALESVANSKGLLLSAWKSRPFTPDDVRRLEDAPGGKDEGVRSLFGAFNSFKSWGASTV
eukprot:5208756-Prymnesium_polylepis.1